MKGRLDAALNRRATGRAKGARPAPPRGGKALQRLFAYLGQRDPSLTDDVVAAVAAPKDVRDRFSVSKGAMRMRTRTAASARTRGVPTAAKSFARSIGKAAGALSTGAPISTRQPRGVAAAPPAPPPAWEALGPNVVKNGQTYGTNRVDVIGRVSSITVDPRDPKHVLLGAAGGGIWESRDAGATWDARGDQLPSLAIGAIAFDPRDPTRVYAGSGEGNFYATLGAGVFRSTDGGTTWAALVGAPFTGAGFFDLVVDPGDSLVLYAATTSGFYKSTDGGSSWSLKRGGRCWDISIHPGGGSVQLLAAFVDGLFQSTNAGNSFTGVPLPNAPASAWTRLSVDRVVTAPDTAYAFAATADAAFLWRRKAATWSSITPPSGLAVQQAWYDWYVAATPDDENEVYLGAIDGYRGNLTGTTWKWRNITTQGGQSIHPDQHCLAFAPNDSKVIYAGNDGGIFRSANGGGSWKALNKGLGISELEYLAADPNTSKWVMAGTQDNGTVLFTGAPAWDHVADGDGGDCGVNQLDPNIVYHSYYNVSLERSTNKGASWTTTAPPNVPSLFYPPVEVFGSTVAIGATSLLVTRTGSQPWTVVPLGLASGEVSSAMREIDANTIVIGTNKGRMVTVTWNGATWTRTPLASPTPRYVSCIAVDPSNPQRLWVTISQVGGGSVYRSDDAGSSWNDCSAGLPRIPMNAVVVDPANFKRVWVAADVGVYQTLDLGSTWSSFANGLPNAIASDLLFHRQDRRLICATRNRGAWAVSIP